VVSAVAPEAAVLRDAVRLADSLKDKDPKALQTVKRRLYPEATSMLTAKP
jgi:enoyl-CoA hydratase/carnithine racemase